MNVEFHYYSTAFLGVKAGFSRADAQTIAYAGQYVDHHHRSYEITTPRGLVVSGATQNFSFWDPGTVAQVLAPFHFLPAGSDAGVPPTSCRADGRISVWDVRPNSAPAKILLTQALKTKNLHRVGLALHTFSDTWAHQNFTARDEDWNRLDPSNRLPAPGHAQAGWAPDLWLASWTDRRLSSPEVTNLNRFAECARKVYRYLCTYRGKDFHQDEEEVAAELLSLVEAGRGRESWEDRALEYIVRLDLEPYDPSLWVTQALELDEAGSPWPVFDRWRKWGEELIHRTGLGLPQVVRAKSGFEDTPWAAWIRAAEEHRALALSLIRDATGGIP